MFILQIPSYCPQYEFYDFMVNVRFSSVHLHYGILFLILFIKMQLPFHPLNLP